MTVATIITVAHFNEYKRMAAVLAESVLRHAPNVKLSLVDPGPHEIIDGVPEHCPANLLKMKHWHRAVMNAEIGECLILMDCDMLVLRDISRVFDLPFDIAVTVRDYKIRINGGVVFVRCTRASKRFVDKWYQLNMTLLTEEEREHLAPRLRKYGGMNQAALINSMRTLDWPCEIVELPCRVWNNCDQTWAQFDTETCVLHVKGQLRRIALGDPSKYAYFEDLGPLASVWKSYETEVEHALGLTAS